MRMWELRIFAASVAGDWQGSGDWGMKPRHMEFMATRLLGRLQDSRETNAGWLMLITQEDREDLRDVLRHSIEAQLNEEAARVSEQQNSAEG